MNVRRTEASPGVMDRLLSAWRLLTRVVLVSLALTVVAGGMGGLVMLYQWLDRPIAVIAVEGEFQYIRQGELEKLVEPSIEGGIVSLDLGEIAARLEVNPWIKTATVSRQWPDGVLIRVEEEVPIARWGKQGFLNSRGQILNVDDNSGLQNLPLLEGAEGEAFMVMRRYRELAGLLSQQQLKIQRMTVDRLSFWTVRLVDGPELVMGSEQLIEKTQRFLQVRNAMLPEQIARMERVDLRYDNGLAVQWHPAGDELASVKHTLNIR